MFTLICHPSVGFMCSYNYVSSWPVISYCSSAILQSHVFCRQDYIAHMVHYRHLGVCLHKAMDHKT